MRCLHGMDSRFCAVCNKVSAFGNPRSAVAWCGSRWRTSNGFSRVRMIVPRAARLAMRWESAGTPLQATGSSRIRRRRRRGCHPTGTALLMRMTAWNARAQRDGTSK